MKLSNIKISAQLQIGFAVILIFVILIGGVSWSQNDKLAEQTRLIYNHPLQVRRAIGEFKADVLSIHSGMNDLMLSANEAEIAEIIGKMDAKLASANDQIGILDSQYLGPHSNVDQVKQEFIQWNAIRTETIRLLREGKRTEAAARNQSSGMDGKQAEVVLATLEAIDIFARNKGDELFATSQQLNDELNRQLLLLVSTVFILTFVIVYYLLRIILHPLGELTRTTQAFRTGNLSSRSTYAKKNEFGELTESYNKLAETIELDLDLKEKAAALSGLMLSFDEAGQFFQKTLSAIAEHTGSQMAAVYLLSSNKKTFDHFVSIGLAEDSRASFAADNFEGVFGIPLTSKKIQHIGSIPSDTRFTFSTVTGTFIPREIITIPVVSENSTVAIISLATISVYSEQTIRYINEIWSTLTARVIGILALRQIHALAESLNQQNRELETQKNELSAQTSELNQQNIELEFQKKQLVEASRLKTSFISNMSHELRTPLNSVIALSGVLTRRLVDLISKEEYSYLEVIERNGKQLLALINDILDLSRIEAGKEEIEISQFNINKLLSELVSVLNPLAHEKNIQIVQHPNPGLALIISDVAKCRHILQNLMGNAVKFTEKGQVEISVLQKGDKIQIVVSDTGIGISETQLPIIFDEFRQADASTSRRYGGTGLGLAIVKKYAQLLGGKVTVKSALDKGSEFTLTLPMRLEENSTDWNETETSFSRVPLIATLPEVISHKTEKTLLVVEDSEPAIIQLKDILEEYGYHILIARNGEEALEVIQVTLPDAIILDLMMPGMDGFEVLKTVRAADITAHLPVLILTAKHISKDELKFLKRNNVHQLIQKGNINRGELLNAVFDMVSPKTDQDEKPYRILPVIEGTPVVLVVEDNPDNMLTAKALLADKFTVIEATDGNAGVAQAKKHIPNLILMDIALPGMDGIKAFKEIRSETITQNIPVIALTASAMTSDREAILAYGFEGYIAKPIDRNEFMHTIQQVLYGKD